MTASPRLLAAALLLSAWLGAAILTAAAVAPAAFAVLPSRTLAGALVGRVLPVVFVAGLVTGLAVVVLAAGQGARFGVAVAAAIAAVACAAAQFGIAPRIERLRAQIGGPVDALPADDARRVAFGVLHGYSVGGLAVAMLAAATALWFLVPALRSRA